MFAVSRIVSLVVLLTLILILGISFFKVVAPFLLPLFLAAVVAMISQPLFGYFRQKLKGHNRLAAGLTTIALILAVVIPISVVTFVGTVQIYTITQGVLDSGRLDHWVAHVRQQLDTEKLFKRVQSFLPTPANVEDPKQREKIKREQFERYLKQWQQELSEQLRAFAQTLLGLVTETLGTTLSLIGAIAEQFIAMLIFLVALYYFLADGPHLLEATEEMIPLHLEYQRELFHEFSRAVRAVVIATFAAAITQGAATSALLWGVGRATGTPAFCHVVLYWLLATLAALIPLAGTSLVWGPAAVWLFLTGHWGGALVLLLGGGIGVGSLDNLVRIVVLNTDAQLHPVLAFVSVLGGLRVFGIWGVFIGPIIACTLHGLVKIFNKELREFSRERYFILNQGEQAHLDQPLFYEKTEKANVEGAAKTGGRTEGVSIEPGTAAGDVTTGEATKVKERFRPTKTTASGNERDEPLKPSGDAEKSKEK